MDETDWTNLTERQRRDIVSLVVFGASVLTLGVGMFAALFMLGAPEWALALPLVIMAVLLGAAIFVVLRRLGVPLRQAGIWGVLAGSPLADLLWFMKDPVRREARQEDPRKRDDRGT